ncbi:hypothetical protein IAU60_005261 [Kwoniella sp. DSM 27419]
MAAIAAQPHHLRQQYHQQQHQQHYQQQTQQYHYHHGQPYPSHSVMEDGSEDDQSHEIDDDDDDDDDESIEGDAINPVQAHFYHQQRQQAMYYQQHQAQHGVTPVLEKKGGPSRQPSQVEQREGDDEDGEEEDYVEVISDTDSMPDENIDFSLTHALQTFLATVEGQASVVKGDSLVLLDDANSYWWLVRVLKTEDVGYIPAENVETPYERLARLNKHRNVDVAAATDVEKQAGTVPTRDRLRGVIAGKARGLRRELSGDVSGDNAGRRVVFAPPTYVDHPGVTWSSDEEDSQDEGEMEAQQVEGDARQEQGELTDGPYEMEVDGVDRSLESEDMEPDDGIEWAEGAGIEAQRRTVEQRQQRAHQPVSSGMTVQPKSNNPFAPRQDATSFNPSASTTSLASNASSILDPAQASNGTRRITATPAVAGGPLLPSAIQQQQNGQRNVSGQSLQSVTSTVSVGSSQRSSTPTSPDDASKKARKMKKASKEDLDGDKKKRGMLGGLFHRKGKDKGSKGVNAIDARSSEDSMVSGAADTSPMRQGRWSEEGHGRPTSSLPGQRHLSQQQQRSAQSDAPNGVSAHGLRLQQQDQARMQSYTNKYLNKSPSSDLHSASTAEAAAAVAQSAAAMRLAASMNAGGTGKMGGRPGSIILSPNPAGPPLLNVIRIFAGDHIKSESSFKTALVNETTSASDLIKQALQRFHLSRPSHGNLDAIYYITVRDVNGEEMELSPEEKPLAVFQDAVSRWARESDEDLTGRMGAITPTVKRSSVSSISSVISLSSHPAIARLGMNDFSDDSAVKIYFNRRRPGSTVVENTPVVGSTSVSQPGMPEPASEFSSYSTQLSTYHGSPSSTDNGEISTPPMHASRRFNPSLTVDTNGQASPERYSSPSARFTVQLVIHPGDLPDGSVFDPASDAIVPKSLLRDRQTAAPSEARRRLFVMPRNANVVEAIEQGLERFGISDGVVDGGDDVEDKVGKRRSLTKFRYTLAAVVNGEERPLSISSKVLDAYEAPPNLRPMERTTPEQRRRSRDVSYNQGSAADILPTDPVFVLRRVVQRGLANARVEMGTPRQGVSAGQSKDTRSPAEIIAAQRAASRANQKALLSAQNNHSQGVDIVLPDQKGTLRSSRLIEPSGGEVVRYSYIDDDGETYDISELLEEEWGKDSGVDTTGAPVSSGGLQPPLLARINTDRSEYITAPSTPEEGLEKEQALRQLAAPAPIHDPRLVSQGNDILKGVAQAASASTPADGPRIEEKLIRLIEKVKSGSVKGSNSTEDMSRPQALRGAGSREELEQDRQRESGSSRSSSRAAASGRTTPQATGDRSDVHATPRASASATASAPAYAPERRSSSRQSMNQPAASPMAFDHTAAASVNRIISGASSRHRQQPSIASIMSMSEHDHHSSPLRGDRDKDRDSTGTSTPVTATSSTHPTPPFSGAVFTRAVGSVSPTPRNGPLRYKDDFGIKDMMAVIAVRAREYAPAPGSRAIRRGSPSLTSTSTSSTASARSAVSGETGTLEREREEQQAERVFGPNRVDWTGVHPEIKMCFEGVARRLEKFDRDIDELLAEVGRL